jgi:protein disulfide-isomerase A1
MVFLNLFLSIALSSAAANRSAVLDLPYYLGSNLTSLLAATPRTILFRADDNISAYDFASPAIHAFRDRVFFALAHPDEMPASLCVREPCILPFDGRTPLKLDPYPLNASTFLLWVEMVINPSQYNILDRDQLEELLDTGDPLLFAVDADQLPEEPPVTLHIASADLLHTLGFVLNPGFYVWRPQEQLFVEYNGSFVAQAASPITYWTKLSLGMKGWVMGYLVDAITDDEVAILKNLSQRFDTEYCYSFVNFRSSRAQFLIERWRLKGIKFPTFGLAHLESMRFDHWLVMDPSVVHSFEYLVGFVQKVAAGEVAPTVLSESIPTDEDDQGVQKIVGANFLERVYNDSMDCLVLFTKEDTLKSTVYRVVLSAAAALFNETFVTFYWIDVRTNDLPAHLPEMSTYPTLMLWPAGQKDQPIVYHGGLTLPELLAFISRAARHSREVSAMMIEEAKDRVSEKLNALFTENGEDEL